MLAHRVLLAQLSWWQGQMTIPLFKSGDNCTSMRAANAKSSDCSKCWQGCKGSTSGGTPSPRIYWQKIVYLFSHVRTSVNFIVLHLLQYTYQAVFPTAQNSFWTNKFWCHIVLLLVFVLSLPHRQNVSLWGLFHLVKQKKSHPGRDWVKREDGAWRPCSLGSKTAEHSVQCGQVHW